MGNGLGLEGSVMWRMCKGWGMYPPLLVLATQKSQINTVSTPGGGGGITSKRGC